jgi:hypothetical protein
MDQRHTLFQLVRLPSSATVGGVAKAHCIKVETLWMLNAGFATYLNTLNLTIHQRKDYSYKMAHSCITSMQYGKTMINVDDLD